MNPLSTKTWTKRDCWVRPSGELAVRPGLRRIAVPSSAGRRFVAGFTVQNPWTLEVWHYVAEVSAAGGDLHVRIYDDNFALFQDFDTGVDAIPRGFSRAVVEGMLLIGSPDMPTLFGLLGSGIGLAVKVASTNPATTALTIPRGVVTSWCNRAVICDGSNMFVSDPVAIGGGDVRTFVAQNQNQRPGTVFGAHEGAGGMLVLTTSAGTYALDSAAAAVGIVGSNGTDWRMLSHTPSFSYDSSCVVRGRVFALTQRGYAPVDTETSDEEMLDDPKIARRFGPRIASTDWRAARLLAGDDGPIVAEAAHCSVHDLAMQMRSWWTCRVPATPWTVRGVLHDDDGGVMLLAEDGVYVVDGNADGDAALAAYDTSQARGVLFGRAPTLPGQNPTMRDVRASAATGGASSLRISVRGDDNGVDDPTEGVDDRALVIGTSVWGASGVIYQPTPLTSLRWQGDMNGAELTIEVAADFGDTAIDPVVTTDLSTSASMRPGPLRGNAA